MLLYDSDPFDYFPLKSGEFPISSIKMEKFSNLPQEQQKIFQFDNNYPETYVHKAKARQENIHKYYQKIEGIDNKEIIRFIMDTLVKDYPDCFYLKEANGVITFYNKSTSERFIFDSDTLEYIPFDSPYVDALDALASQVQEDIVICTLGEDGIDFVSSVHLCSPFGWSAEGSIGKTFMEIHKDVTKADASPVIKNPSKIVKSIINTPSTIQRVGAISFRANTILNRHPDNNIKDSWHFDDTQQLYLRFERQTVTGFPNSNSFLFTIRTYFNDLLKANRIAPTLKALKTYPEDIYPREFVNEHKEQLIEFLEKKKWLLYEKNL